VPGAAPPLSYSPLFEPDELASELELDDSDFDDSDFSDELEGPEESPDDADAALLFLP